MTISGEDDLQRLRDIGRIVAMVLRRMAEAMEPGMTTAELDAIGRALLEREGARSAPEACYNFPGATCISINPEVAHGIPGDRVIAAGDLVNIDVSAEKDGLFADNGGSFVVPPSTARLDSLCGDGRKALAQALLAVRAGRPLDDIAMRVGRFARRRGYSQIHNLLSHGVGRTLHDEPREIATSHGLPDRGPDQRLMADGMVMAIEPFLSTGAEWAEQGADGWTLLADDPASFTVQYEHTVVVTRRGPIILTLEA
ncbi:MAG: type I methionyl aminopeptidase [Alphaproteobacteria bacterium]